MPRRKGTLETMMDQAPAHAPKKKRAHLAQEYRDRQQYAEAEELTQHLFPYYKNCALGLVQARPEPERT